MEGYGSLERSMACQLTYRMLVSSTITRRLVTDCLTEWNRVRVTK